MRRTKIKFLIPLVLLFMFIGFATVSTTLSINGDMELLSDLDDFNIYYSRAIVNGVEDTSIIKSSTELDFGAALKTVGVDYVIEYDITNASSAFDAQVSINCSASTEYFSINNEFDNETPIGARQTRTGVMTLRKIQTVAGDEQTNTISCDIVATPVERNEEGVGEIPIPLENPYYIGREIAIGEEKFNIISEQADTITMLAQYNLGTDYRQTINNNLVTFSNVDAGWEYAPGPKEIDIQEWSTNPKVYVNEYVSYLKDVTNSDSLHGDLITMSQLKKLGCILYDDYSANFDKDLWCGGSPYEAWLVTKQYWWTKSAIPDYDWGIWAVYPDSVFIDECFDSQMGIRPVITISKEIVFALIKYKTYDIGEEISIGSEKFNVISQTPTSVSMLAQYNIQPSISPNYQTDVQNSVSFSYDNGWVPTPGPQEIPEEYYSSSIGYYIREYLLELSHTDATGRLITLTELGKLGCYIQEDYSLSGSENCTGSSNYSWLVNGQKWWTQSSTPDDWYAAWVVLESGGLTTEQVFNSAGIRPVITISKAYLN